MPPKKRQLAPAHPITVGIRLRPFLPEEHRWEEPSTSTGWHAHPDRIDEVENGEPRRSYPFELVFNNEAGNGDVYEALASPIVAEVLSGINVTLFAYGQTSSGKTHSMRGVKADSGLVERSVSQLFAIIEQQPEKVFLLRVTYVEIYNEDVLDLLHPTGGKIKPVREAKGRFFVEHLTERIVTSPSEVMQAVNEGEAVRHIGRSNLNDESSRSHVIFSMTVESADRTDDDAGVIGGHAFAHQLAAAKRSMKDAGVRVSQLNLVDLAGSESLNDMSLERETKSINLSLAQLKLVIQTLHRGEKYIPYRNSMLTKILKNSLGGNARTAVLCCMTPLWSQLKQTRMTLHFGHMARDVINRPIVNLTFDDESSLLIKQYRQRIQSLETQLLHYKKLEEEREQVMERYSRLEVELQELRQKEKKQDKGAALVRSSRANLLLDDDEDSVVETTSGGIETRATEARLDALEKSQAKVVSRLEDEKAARRKAEETAAAMSRQVAVLQEVSRRDQEELQMIHREARLIAQRSSEAEERLRRKANKQARAWRRAWVVTVAGPGRQDKAMADTLLPQPPQKKGEESSDESEDGTAVAVAVGAGSVTAGALLALQASKKPHRTVVIEEDDTIDIEDVNSEDDGTGRVVVSRPWTTKKRIK